MRLTVAIDAYVRDQTASGRFNSPKSDRGCFIPSEIEIPPSFTLIGKARQRWVRENQHRFIWLYAIEEGAPGEQGPIKIGIAQDPDGRLSELQVGNSRVLTGMAAWRTVPEDEAWLHKLLWPIHIRGEWFEAHPFLAEFVLRWGGNYKWESQRYWAEAA